MEEKKERRKEHRMLYHWPVWFKDEFNQQLVQGQMIDISSKAAAFTCHAYEGHPSPGQQVTAHFSVPLSGLGDSFAMRNFTRSGCTYRVDDVNLVLRRIAVQFAEPLPFRPGEQDENVRPVDLPAGINGTQN
jgi:hypothetical protein